ncbi:MAG TPA: ROK family protein [Puia sp.]|nr:ROK family protein [Puia sp.]
MRQSKVIGIDLGATNIRGAVVSGDDLSDIASVRIHSNGEVDEVLGDIYSIIDTLMGPGVAGIGIGVPSVVDVDEGIVYDVQYIPSWVEVPLKRLLEARYHKPVYVNNDANCFALGEYYFGKGKGVSSMVGLTIGTGLGGGIIIHNKLFAGSNCGAGEIGCLPYKDKILEYYCSGSFFKNVYDLDGVAVYEAARKGEARALQLYAELGQHVGQAIKMVMYTYDPQLIVLGGSVSQAYDLFKETMWKEVRTLVYAKSLERIRVEVSNLKNSGILGAAALYYDAKQ